MKHLLSILILFLSMLSASAQKLEFNVVSFGLDKFSTAAQRGSQYAATDGNGDLYSIIKVKDVDGQPVPDGFMFDFGLPNTLKVEPQPNGEQWVWVQRNAKQVTIYHNNYRTIEKYNLGLTIEAGRVYEMVVTMDRIERIVKQTVRKQVLQFAVQPADEHAVVKVKEASAADFEAWGEVDSQGVLSRYIPFGDYDYMVVADDYDTSYGRVTLNDAANNHVERVTLTPAFGFLSVVDKGGISGADILVNDKRIGTVPYADKSRRWAPGTYQIEVVKGDLYRPYRSTFDIRKGETTTVAPLLTADYANVQLSVEGDATISIDKEQKGRGSWSGALKAGQYVVACTLANHRESSQVITVEAGRDARFTLTPPTPITGSLFVNSTPSGATIKIDGRECGTTPKAFPELLIGSHEVELSLAGYEPEVRNVQVKEGEEATVEATINTPEKPKGEPSTRSSINEIEESMQPIGIQTFTVNGVSFNMVLVEHGTFLMGSKKGNQKPIHSVTISKDYWMGETEVTQALWYAVMGQKPTSSGDQWGSFRGLGDNYPAYYISWDDCQEFITKLNQLTGHTFRLPTEAEWEYAAKGGNKSKGYIFSGSNKLKEVAPGGENFRLARAHPVASKKANELGFYDMSGNVHEWCNDWYGGYSNTAVTDPTGAMLGSYRVIRGGSWFDGGGGCSTVFRYYGAPTIMFAYIGLRLALSVSE